MCQHDLASLIDVSYFALTIYLCTSRIIETSFLQDSTQRDERKSVLYHRHLDKIPIVTCIYQYVSMCHTYITHTCTLMSIPRFLSAEFWLKNIAIFFLKQMISS